MAGTVREVGRKFAWTLNLFKDALRGRNDRDLEKFAELTITRRK